MADTDVEISLADQFEALRETVETLKDALGNRLRVTLRALNNRSYLGQSVTLVAKVTDFLSHEPQRDVPITFASTWGRLESAEGYILEQGNTLTVRTDVDGIVTLKMVSPLSEDLPYEEQVALETQLQALNAGANTPQETEAGLQEMVRQYRWEANAAFRRAVDLFFQEFRPRLNDTVSRRDRMLRWAYFESTIVAYAQSMEAQDEEATSVLSAAVLNLRFKDWLAPFLQTYYTMSASENSLGSVLQNEKGRTTQSGELLNNFYGRIRDFVHNERGALGTYIGNKVASSSLQHFAQTGLDDLPLATRVSLAEGLKAASGTIVTAGVSVLEGLAHTGADLRQELNSQITGEVAGTIGGLRGRLQAEVGESLQGFRTQIGELSADSLKKNQDELGSIKAGVVETFRKDINSFKSDSLNGFQTDIGKARDNHLEVFKTDAGNLRTGILQVFQKDIGTARENAVKTLQTDIGTVRNEGLKAFQNDVGTAKATLVETFNTELTNVRKDSLQGFKGEIDKTRDTTLQALNTSLIEERDKTFQVFKQDVTKLQDTSFKVLQTDVSKLKTETIKGFEKDVVNVRNVNFKGFNEDIVKPPIKP